MYIPRQIDMLSSLKNKSMFLLGPRQTGKISLIRQVLGKFLVYDLLDSDVYLTLSCEPKRLQQELIPGEKSSLYTKHKNSLSFG
jgi:uncharacterized protein